MEALKLGCRKWNSTTRAVQGVEEQSSFISTVDEDGAQGRIPN
jgi:hypothetical protein